MSGKAVKRSKGRASQLDRLIGIQANQSDSQDLKPFRTSAGETFRPALWASSAYWMWIGWRGVICRHDESTSAKEGAGSQPIKPTLS